MIGRWKWSRLDRRGVALMLVLWIIVVLGGIGLGVAAAARGRARLVLTTRARVVARYAAESGVAATAARWEALLAAAGNEWEEARAFTRLDDEVARWAERPLGSARYQVAVADLGARIDLNRAAPSLLLAFLAQFVGTDEAEALTDALVDWRDRDHRPRARGAEASDYRQAGSLFVPPNAPLLRLDELTRIRGFDDSLADVIAPFITVRGSGRINLNTAPREVLAALPQFGPIGADAVLAARQQGRVLDSPEAVRTLLADRGAQTSLPLGRTFGTVAEHVLVISRGWEGGFPLTHEVQAVLRLATAGEDGRRRVEIVSWTERDL